MPWCSLSLSCILRGLLPGKLHSNEKPHETAPYIDQNPPILLLNNHNGHEQPPPYTPPSAPSIKLFHSPLEGKPEIDILFVPDPITKHGTTWTSPGAIESWPGALLSPQMPTARILMFTHREILFDWGREHVEKCIHDHGWDLLSSLSSFREDEGTDERPIIFVCDGLGGLVCQNALFTSSKLSDRDPPNKIFLFARGIIFLGTPFDGAGLANCLKRALCFIDPEEQRDFLDNIDFLINHSNERLEQNTENLKSMYRTRNARRLLQMEIACFSKDLQLESGFDTPIGIRRNYVDMTKFSNTDDASFKDVCEKLRQWVTDADANKRQPATSSSAQNVDIVNQCGSSNCQYNLVHDRLTIVHGHCFKAIGDQNFAAIPPK